MSSRNFLTAGLDLSLLPSEATNAQIMQALQQAYPASGLGIIIYQSATPDVATYTEYVTFLWVNTTTGELKYWNGTSWQLVSGFATIADASVTVSKLSPSGGAALQLIRINAGGTAFEFVNPADLFTTNSFPLNKLINASGAGYVPYSGVGGVYAEALLNTLINTWLTTANIPNTRVMDVSGVGLPNQVAYIADTFNALSYAYVESLLRANQTPTNKLQFAAGAAGKYVKVNVSGTDLDYTADTGIKAGILKYSVAKGTAAQSVPITTETVVEWNTEVDTEGAISALDTATDRFTLATGTYLIDISIPVYQAAANLTGVALLYDVTGSTIVASCSFAQTGDVDSQTINIKATVKVTAATNVYDVRIYASQAVALGNPANLASYAETYQQMSVLKLT